MKFRTEISLKQEKNGIDYQSKILLLGSCFSDNIGKKFEFYKLNTFVNPFGVLFNPVSIKNVVFRSLQEDYFNKEDFIFHNDLWKNLESHSALSDVSLDTALQKTNTALRTTNNFLQTASHLFITLGSAWVYRYNKTNKIVANCHKIPQKEFKKELLTVAEIKKSLISIVTKIKGVNPNIICVFTLSPVRHLKDGFAENNRSKAHLLTAIHDVILKNNDVFYFPAYEILIDDLRDYRFYKNDFLHPNTLAVNYIWEKLKDAWITKKAKPLMIKIENIQKRLQHKTDNPNTKNHQQFLLQLKEDMLFLKKEFGISF